MKNFNGFKRTLLALSLMTTTAGLLTGCNDDSSSSNGSALLRSSQTATNNNPDKNTKTPIKHVVVIFQENVSFDHYFGTYPKAANPAGQPAFTAAANTPVANTLATPLDTANGFKPLSTDLLNQNPTSLNAENGTSAINPFRLDRTQAATADQDHDYDDEQKAFNNGKMDLFPATVGVGDTVTPNLPAPLNEKGLVMGYYDGNTVTAMWNYAQNFAMNDNSYGTTFGPSAVGAINLISGQTNGVNITNVAAKTNSTTGAVTSNLDNDLANDGNGGLTIVADPQPLGDACSTRDAVQMKGQNVGDLLNAANVSWGFFQGGFDLTVKNADGSTGCSRTSTSTLAKVKKVDYIPHHEPFQYYASTANPTHARPSSVSAIGHSLQADGKSIDPANHQYDIHDFFDAVNAGNFPAVSFLKAPGYQDGHAGYSTPLDEQNFLVNTINTLQKSPEWSDTLVLIAYDDSDGWYDHQRSPIVNASNISATNTAITLDGIKVVGLGDYLNGAGACNTGVSNTLVNTILTGVDGKAAQGRCGYGPRLPLLAISPYAKTNYIDHTVTDQTSILKFIEDNWLGSKRIAGSYDSLAGSITNMLDFSAPKSRSVQLDPTTGLPL